MANNNNYDAALVKNLLAGKNFNAVHNHFVQCNVSSEQLVIFLKRNKQIWLQPEYWVSNLPTYALAGFLNSDIYLSFFDKYFNKGEHCNDLLNHSLYTLAPEIFVQFFKLKKAFLYPPFWQSLERLAISHPSVNKLVLELGQASKTIRQVDTALNKDLQLIMQISYDKALFGFVLWLQQYKVDASRGWSNRSEEIMIEMAVVRSINEFIKFYIQSAAAKPPSFFNNDKEMQLDWKRYSPANPLFKENSKLNITDPDYELISDFIKRDIERQNRRGIIDLYLAGYLDFVDVVKQPGLLRCNKDYLRYKKNDKKSGYKERPFLNKHKLDMETRISGYILKDHLRVYAIAPVQFIDKGTKSIDLFKCLELLRHLSVFKGPVERTSFVNPLTGETKTREMNRAPEKFAQYFGTNTCISMYEYAALVKAITGFFKWSEEEVNDILQFLMYDLSSATVMPDWLCRPLIKKGNYVYWLGSFCKDRDWFTIIYNKFKSDKGLKNDVKAFNQNLETAVGNCFRKAGYKVKVAHKYSYNGGISGDIDVCAYKNGELIIIEVKSGIFTEDFTRSSYLESLALEETASEQLLKAATYLQSQWQNAKKELNIETPKPFSKIRVIPLIVTNYPEGDLQTYRHSTRKISLLELDIIVRNAKKELYEIQGIDATALNLLMNGNNPHVKGSLPNKVKRNYDLWNGKKQFNADILIDCIDSNKVWSDIEDDWQFDNVEVSL